MKEFFQKEQDLSARTTREESLLLRLAKKKHCFFKSKTNLFPGETTISHPRYDEQGAPPAQPSTGTSVKMALRCHGEPVALQLHSTPMLHGTVPQPLSPAPPWLVDSAAVRAIDQECCSSAADPDQ